MSAFTVTAVPYCQEWNGSSASRLLSNAVGLSFSQDGKSAEVELSEDEFASYAHRCFHALNMDPAGREARYDDSRVVVRRCSDGLVKVNVPASCCTEILFTPVKVLAAAS